MPLLDVYHKGFGKRGLLFFVRVLLAEQMDLQHFIQNFSQDQNLGRAIALYIIRPTNLSQTFQGRNYFRSGVAGSRETQNIDRSATPSGGESKASSLYSRAAMYFANWIAGGKIMAALVLPPSVVNAPTGPTITRILQKTNPGDNRPAYALRGSTMAVALEKILHQELDDMPKIKRARTERVEWFQSQQEDLKNAKLAMQAVGQGIYYDFSKHAPNAMPADLVGKGVKLSGGQTLDTTTHAFRQSPRLLELMQDDVTEEDGSVKLSLDDIEDIRNNMQRGQQILELITRKGPKKAATTQTGAQTGTATTQTTTVAQPNVRTRSRRVQTTAATPVTVRLTRARINQLREAAETNDQELKRKRLARALAQLA